MTIDKGAIALTAVPYLGTAVLTGWFWKSDIQSLDRELPLPDALLDPVLAITVQLSSAAVVSCITYIDRYYRYTTIRCAQDLFIIGYMSMISSIVSSWYPAKVALPMGRYVVPMASAIAAYHRVKKLYTPLPPVPPPLPLSGRRYSC